MTLAFSRRLAIFGGVVLPIGETARRWHQLGDPLIWLTWADDIVIGGFLLYGAWRAGRDAAAGRPVLAAAWGFACGLGYASFVFSLLTAETVDPSGFSMQTAVAVKGVMLALGIVGLVGALRAEKR